MNVEQTATPSRFGMGKGWIRINTVHPNAVFDTGLWNNEILSSITAGMYFVRVHTKNRNIGQRL